MEPIFTLKTGEFFAGAGGLGIGLLLAAHPRIRFQPVFAVDTDALALKTYEYNLKWLTENAPHLLPEPPALIRKSIVRLGIDNLLLPFNLQREELDLLVGGPPCQGYSPSNRRAKQQKRSRQNNLIKTYLEKIEILSPRMFLIENVQGVQWTEPTKKMMNASAQGSLSPKAYNKPDNVKDFLIQSAQSLGYYIWHDFLNAADFGVPQNRMRFFLFGIRKDLIGNRESISLLEYLKKKKCSEPVSVIRAIGDLPKIGNGQNWKGTDYHPSEDSYVRLLRRYMSNGDLYDHFATNHKEYVIERYRQIPEGGNWEDIKALMDNYKDVDKTHSNIYRRLIGDAPAHTISHYRKSMTIHPVQNRGLSFREACRLQSFPDWFRFQAGTDKNQQQLANAVPPLLASAVAWAIGEFYCDLLPDSGLGN
jgi:DNA (cytosine-5)-methyltransferase 1